MAKSSFVDFKAVKAAVKMEEVLRHYNLLDGFKRSTKVHADQVAGVAEILAWCRCISRIDMDAIYLTTSLGPSLHPNDYRIRNEHIAG